MEFEQAIQRAYSSKLRIEHRGDRAVILKSVETQERKNELAFHELLERLGLPRMEIIEEGDDLVIDFIEGADTLADHETSENYLHLGRVLKMLHSQEYPMPFWIDENGEKQEIDWNQFISKQLNYGITRQKERDGLDEKVVERVARHLSEPVSPTRISAIHGDLHANNELLKDGNLYLFDKADHIFAGDPLYDMSLFGITLPGIYGVGSRIETDQALMTALTQGYGADVLADRYTFDCYVLLRSLERWPNPFEEEIPEIVRVILEKLD